MEERSLAALRLDEVPSETPLLYPGRMVSEPGLLCYERLLRLVVSPQPVGSWMIDGGPSLDEALRSYATPTTGERVPVIALGSNASPGQMRYKLNRFHLPAVIPMVPVRVTGISIGVSAHISPAGYVAASPYLDPGRDTDLTMTWLDHHQLKVIDDTEIPEYRRIFISGERFPMVLPSGEVMRGAYIYVNSKGVLKGSTGRPRRPMRQHELLQDLLAHSSELRALLGPDPESWIARAGTDVETRLEGTRIFEREGWVLSQFETFSDTAITYTYDELSARS